MHLYPNTSIYLMDKVFSMAYMVGVVTFVLFTIVATRGIDGFVDPETSCRYCVELGDQNACVECISTLDGINVYKEAKRAGVSTYIRQSKSVCNCCFMSRYSNSICCNMCNMLQKRIGKRSLLIAPNGLYSSFDS
ncbi:hypothetical protein ACJMK2_043293 [Sinanodonta woodiana]|uniref:Transmembrane protein n=1 Tax=Sinanodonta woodiana TaxID=1069815 RepID=A0ABD3VWF7_SINWO